MCFFVCGVSISLWKERTNTNFVTKFGFGQKKKLLQGNFFFDWFESSRTCVKTLVFTSFLGKAGKI